MEKKERKQGENIKSTANFNTMKNEKHITSANRALKNEKMRKGLWREKYEILNREMRERCKEENAPYTHGGWKNRKICSTKSQWQYEIENKIAEGKYKEEKMPSVKIKTHEAAILYDKVNEKFGAYEVEIEKENGEIIAKIIYGRRKLKVKVHEEMIKNEKIIKLALEKGARIYTIDEIIEK